MERRENGSILCSKDLDDLLSLQIWRAGGAPRLGIYNKIKEKMKPVRFSWLEDKSRVLKMSHKRGKSVEYGMDVLEEAVRDLIAEMSKNLLFRSLCLKATVLFQDIAMEPKVVMDRKDFALLPETKRRSLWISDLSDGKDSGVFLPCFHLCEGEKGFFDTGDDEYYIEVPKGGDVRDVRSTGIITHLVSSDPGRWYMPFQVAAVGVILGFSMVGGEAIDLADSLWLAMAEKRLSKINEDLDGQARAQSGKMASFIVPLVRHMPYVDRISYRDHHDSDGILKEEGYTRKRRFDLPAGQIGDISYVVTFYDNEKGQVALACKGNGRTSLHEGEMIFNVPEEVYEQALAADSCGSSPDELYSVVSLIRAWRASNWCRRVQTLAAPALMGHR